MKKYILIVFVISLMFVAISSSAFMITRDSLDRVEIVMAMKGEVCNIENPGCDEPQGDEPIEENTTTALPWDERFDLSAACLRQKMDELDCQGEAKDMIFGQFATFMKNGTEGGKFWSSDIVVIINDNVYGPGMMTAGYWRANDTYKTINFSAGGHYAYMPGEAEHPYKFMGLKYLAFSQPHRFDPGIQPYGSERVNPGFILIYYDEDGTLNIYAHLKENYYKMTAIKKRVENKTWTPPPEPEVPSPEPRQVEVEIPKKIDVPTPIPPPPIYLPGMPETADPKKEHVIPNCNSQGASVCRQDEECPDKWIKAKEDRCCSVICTPVGKKEVPPGLEKKNETESNETEINETEKNKTKKEKPETNITIENETEANESQTTNLTTLEYPNATLGGNFNSGDKVEFLGVKGTIVIGKIKNGKPSENFQINNETATLLVYVSFDNPTYGHMALVHYPQRGEGEYDLYQNDDLIATLKYGSNYSLNAYVTVACEPDKYPEQTQAILIKSFKECS